MSMCCLGRQRATHHSQQHNMARALMLLSFVHVFPKIKVKVTQNSGITRVLDLFAWLRKPLASAADNEYLAGGLSAVLKSKPQLCEAP